MEQFEYTQQDLANKIGKDRSTVANAVRLLKLPNRIKELIAEQKLSMGHARAILAIDSDEDKLFLSEKIIKKGLSVRETESLIRRLSRGEEKKFKEKPNHSEKGSIIPVLEETLSRVFKTRVRLFHKNGKGRIEIRFFSDDEFERILELLESISKSDK